MIQSTTFETENIGLKIGNYEINLTVITNLDDLFDALISKGKDHEDVQDERIPYWAELWASAIAMGEYLVENQLITAETEVLEIGCGLGLPSIIAGFQGAKKVIVSDYFQEALDFAELNWHQNLPHKKAQFLKLDWREPTPSVKTDILLASDVAYEARAFVPLLNAFDTLLKPDGTILISEPNRPISKSFFSNLHTHKEYSVKNTEKTVNRKGHDFLINIYELKRMRESK